jgi:hypothetical protein
MDRPSLLVGKVEDATDSSHRAHTRIESVACGNQSGSRKRLIRHQLFGIGNRAGSLSGMFQCRKSSRKDQYSMPSWALIPERKGCLISVISVTRSAASSNSFLALRPVTTTCRDGRLASRPSTTSASGR